MKLQKKIQAKSILRWVLFGLLVALFITSIILLIWAENKYQTVWDFYNKEQPFSHQIMNWSITKWKFLGLGMVMLMTMSFFVAPFAAYWAKTKWEWKKEGK